MTTCPKARPSDRNRPRLANGWFDSTPWPSPSWFTVRLGDYGKSSAALGVLPDASDLGWKTWNSSEGQSEGFLTTHGVATVLVLSRKINERIWIGNDISFIVTCIKGDTVKIGIDAPKEIAVHRDEVKQAIEKKQNANINPS